ncbi:hypothetical protein D5366_08905 [Neokomagataea tanensis]|uniref:Uncharacterized protein n=2 Tax=Neokomagataea TaxID=1223423 RepID=A0A4Y6V8V2_9PROT|nr:MULTISPECIES: hypothetical protein [Neokomagataea]QDH25308.1 hypothetical protein D5366_08905 [Neokomagataea tanensis]
MKKIIISLLTLFLIFPAQAEEIQWPPEEGAKTPGNALAWPTTLAPVQQSVAAMLNDGGSVLLVNDGKTGPVLALRYKGKVVLCYVVPAPVGGVPTSRCWRLN